MINPYHSTVARVTLNLMCYSVRITSQKAYSRMTNQTPPPPPTAQDNNPKPTAHVSLTHTIQELRDLVFNIALPKTVKVPTDTLHALCDLATSILMGIPAQGAPSKPSDSSRLDAIDRQLADIQACLVTSTALPPDRKSTRLNSSHPVSSRMPSSA